MLRTRIKFCGITRPEDALAAADLGADAIGMVLRANSARRIPMETARLILKDLPPFVTPVGLFVDAPPSQVMEIAGELGLRHVQLHGQESPDDVALLTRLRIIKALRVTAALVDELKAWRGIGGLTGILLETGGTKQAGGSGVENDWPAIRELQVKNAFAGFPSLIAAGGLSPTNVAKVVGLIHPWAVDVSSGIESSPGIKSIEKMRAFADAVRSA